VPSNIAEGQGRLNPAEFRHFLGNARGSLLEMETQIILAQRLGFLEENHGEAALEHCGETGKLINGLIRSLKKSI
jgi:four helix bundle protein